MTRFCGRWWDEIRRTSFHPNRLAPVVVSGLAYRPSPGERQPGAGGSSGLDFGMKHVVGLSGGKDSTALALRLVEIEPRNYEYLITPTGNELPEMLQHWLKLELLLGKKLIRVTANKDLLGLIEFFAALPNHRQRWCTRMLKIEPTIAWIKENSPALLYVGLRADEELREGIYGDQVTSRFPLKEWGWKLADVQAYLRKRGIKIPKRTDCAWCYGQQLSEWWNLWRDHQELYREAVDIEAKYGHTFRSPTRDSWPVKLADLAKLFEAGKLPPRADNQLDLMDTEYQACRACSL